MRVRTRWPSWSKGGTKLLLDSYAGSGIDGAIGIGGAATNLVCSILRALPYLEPKVMVSTVAGTVAVQRYGWRNA